MKWLSSFADVAAIVTALVAAFGYGYYRLTLRKRSQEIEKLLAKKVKPGDDSLKVSQIAKHLNLTEQQVIKAVGINEFIVGSVGQSGEERRLRLIRKTD